MIRFWKDVCPRGMKRKSALIGQIENIDSVFGNGMRERVGSISDCLDEVITSESLGDSLGKLRDVEVLFGTWGMPEFREDQLDALPNLKAVFYAAGAVQSFAGPLLRRGIRVSSAWHANAIPVAEFTLSQIILSCKGYFRNVKDYRTSAGGFRTAYRGPGVFGESVGIIGLGAVGLKLVELLRPFNLKILGYDKFLDNQSFTNLNIERAGLEAVFERAYVVSNHVADKPETVNMIQALHFSSMREGATFINTGRGRTVNHEDLIAVLSKRSDLVALLDVTDPEPLPVDSPLLSLPNCFVSSHIAGSINNEVSRLADYAIKEYERFVDGKPLHFEVKSLA